MSGPLSKIVEIRLLNAMDANWIGKISIPDLELEIPFCSKFYSLSKNSLRVFFMILSVEGATAHANRLCKIYDISYIGT